MKMNDKDAVYPNRIKIDILKLLNNFSLIFRTYKNVCFSRLCGKMRQTSKKNPSRWALLIRNHFTSRDPTLENRIVISGGQGKKDTYCKIPLENTNLDK